MTNEVDSINQDRINPQENEKKGLKKVVSFLLCLIILSTAIASTIYIKNSKPKQKKRKAIQKTTYVDVIKVKKVDQAIQINASGTVIPARELKVKARVSGEVKSIYKELVDGGVITKGTEIICIDPDDYELAMIKAKREVVNARYSLQLEQGHQAVALQEWSLIYKGKAKNSSADTDLILRKPHLEKVKADFAAAEAEYKKAKLNLERTRIIAPFNAFVRSKNIEVGSQISTQETLVELVGTDEYWIKVSLPVDRLKWIQVPLKREDRGTMAKVGYRNQFSTNGNVIKCLGDLESQGHMARLIVSVDGPSAITKTKAPPLLIGEYVSVQLMGKTLKNICRIPRTALRNNKWVWIVSSDNKLDIREVVIAFKEKNYVLIEKGLNSGDQVIISELNAPVKGMKIFVDKVKK